jgi:hypothetical protein
MRKDRALPEDMLKAMEALSPYLHWLSPQFFVLDDQKLNGERIECEYDTQVLIGIALRESVWRKRSEFLKRMRETFPDISKKELCKEIDCCVKNGFLYQVTIGEAEQWLKISPEGSFEAIHEGLPPMYT